MKIGNNFWLKDSQDYKELCTMHDDQGIRFPCGLEFSHIIKDCDIEHACFIPADRRVDGAFYVAFNYIAEAMEKMQATVTYNTNTTPNNRAGNTLTFTPLGITINNKRQIKFIYDDEYTYKLQKTQYKGKNPYTLLAHIIDHTWKNYAVGCIVQAGYVG